MEFSRSRIPVDLASKSFAVLTYIIYMSSLGLFVVGTSCESLVILRESERSLRGAKQSLIPIVTIICSYVLAVLSVYLTVFCCILRCFSHGSQLYPRHRDTKSPALRSILRPSSGSRRPSPQEGPSVQFQTPSSRSSSSNQSISVSQIPLDGPIPPVTLPATQDSHELEQLVLQLVAQLRRQRITPRKVFPRPEGKPDDFPEDAMPDKWTAGVDHGPILDPESVAKLGLHPTLHPILSSTSSDDDHVIWNMIYPPETAIRARKDVQEPHDAFRSEPATFPRVSLLKIVSRSHTWEFNVRAYDSSAGVTIGDVLRTLFMYLSVGLRRIELTTISSEHRQAITAARDARTRVVPPHMELNTNLTILDWISQETHFAGFIHDIEYLEGRFRDTPFLLAYYLMRQYREQRGELPVFIRKTAHSSWSPRRKDERNSVL
ncbi:hypothetical protein F5146DRAFT_1122702 [Armillaria mellea]|nr:hypothetical protein F5146DRAFT_1122702 [Armillaria mellea]